MGDRTPIEVVIYSCPPESVSKVLDVLKEFKLDNEYILPGDPEPDPASPDRLPSLELGRGYIHSETLVGTSSQVAQALPRGAAWKVWEDLLTALTWRHPWGPQPTVRERLAGDSRRPLILEPWVLPFVSTTSERHPEDGT